MTSKVCICSIGAAQGKYKIDTDEFEQMFKDGLNAYIKDKGNDDKLEQLWKWNIKVLHSSNIKARYAVFNVPEMHKKCGYKPDRMELEKIANAGINELLLQSSKIAIEKWTNLSPQMNDIHRITHVITHTATTFHCPSIAHILAHELNCASSTRAIPLNGAGCQGAQSAFYVAKTVLEREPNAVILLAAADIFSVGFATPYHYHSVKQFHEHKESWISYNLMSDGSVSCILQNVDVRHKEHVGKYYIDKMDSFILPKSIWHYSNVSATKELEGSGPATISFIGKELVHKMSVVINKYFISWYRDGMRISNEGETAAVNSLKNTSLAMHAGGKLIFGALEQVLRKQIKLNQEEIDELLKYSIKRYKSSGNFGCASFVHALHDILNDSTHTKDVFCLAFGAGIEYQCSSIRRINQECVNNKRKDNNQQFNLVIAVSIFMFVILAIYVSHL